MATKQELENKQVEKYIDEHLVIIATCRLTSTSEIMANELYLRELTFDRVHIQDYTYWLDDIEIKRGEILRTVKHLLFPQTEG